MSNRNHSRCHSILSWKVIEWVARDLQGTCCSLGRGKRRAEQVDRMCVRDRSCFEPSSCGAYLLDAPLSLGVSSCIRKHVTLFSSSRASPSQIRRPHRRFERKRTSCAPTRVMGSQKTRTHRNGVKTISPFHRDATF